MSITSRELPTSVGITLAPATINDPSRNLLLSDLSPSFALVSSYIFLRFSLFGKIFLPIMQIVENLSSSAFYLGMHMLR